MAERELCTCHAVNDVLKGEVFFFSLHLSEVFVVPVF